MRQDQKTQCSRYVIVKGQKNIKAGGEKHQVTCKRKCLRKKQLFPLNIYRPEELGMIRFKSRRKRIANLENYVLQNFPPEFKERLKPFQVNYKIKKFMTAKPPLQKILK